jgi:uncharacterized protein
MNIGPLTLLVLQPTGFCNIDCSYCYLNGRNSKKVMSEEVLTWALRRTFDSGLLAKEINILWHAGEPLVVGKNFYRVASRHIEQLNSSGTRVIQSIQTNGTLIDADWCELFKSCAHRIGISLDGPEWIHDAHRKTRSGRGTFKNVMRGVSALKAAGVEFTTLAVLTRESLLHVDEVLDFFECEGIRSIAFNLEEIEGNGPRWSFADKPEAEGLFRNFVREALIRHRSGKLAIREISDIEKRLGPSPSARIGSSKPLHFVTVDVDGGFSTYCPELHGTEYSDCTEHVFGNVRINDFIDIVANRHFLRLYDAIMDGVRACARECDRFGICGSNQVGNKFFENGTFASTETLNCRTRIKSVADALEWERLHGALNVTV